MSKRVFVTVGTTEFDQLIRTFSDPQLLSLLVELGFGRLVLQIGRGDFEPTQLSVDGLSIDFYRYKDSISQDLASADLVIGHAGAGTCLETLELGKPLIVVINETLQDNHQLELASQLAKDGHLLFCTCDKLYETLQGEDWHSLRKWQAGDPKVFANWLDSFVGLV